MKISVKYHGCLFELAKIHREYGVLSNAVVQEASARRWSRNKGTSHSYDLQTIVIGKSGYGKSTTLNAILGESIMGTSPVNACTRTVQSFEFKIREGNHFSIVDFPGIGESFERDIEYLSIYKRMVDRSDAIVYLLRADMRDFSIDESTINHLFPDESSRRKLIFGLNFCDKIEPISRDKNSSPSSAQQVNIKAKIAELSKIFSPANQIVPYSAESKWNLAALNKEIIRVMSNSEYVSGI